MNTRTDFLNNQTREYSARPSTTIHTNIRHLTRIHSGMTTMQTDMTTIHTNMTTIRTNMRTIQTNMTTIHTDMTTKCKDSPEKRGVAKN